MCGPQRDRRPRCCGPTWVACGDGDGVGRATTGSRRDRPEVGARLWGTPLLLTELVVRGGLARWPRLPPVPQLQAASSAGCRSLPEEWRSTQESSFWTRWVCRTTWIRFCRGGGTEVAEGGRCGVPPLPPTG
ncbi:hypothetical protein NDU88_004209 [Pleurodeles waltl]|uniref:Uncharacterized protein n=1 Tax=Pleurodeles waltl TaxID=8319 RepID=A0AAV7NM23_PLEWA|nr:hypothetical protein NDU88_004209 [Pleurodeles waltl]